MICCPTLGIREGENSVLLFVDSAQSKGGAVILWRAFKINRRFNEPEFYGPDDLEAVLSEESL
jgi:hypothetical protein